MNKGITTVIIVLAIIILVLIIILGSVKFVRREHSQKNSSSQRQCSYDDYNKMFKTLGAEKILLGHGLLNFLINNDERNDPKIVYVFKRIAERFVEEDDEIVNFIQQEIPDEPYLNKTYKQFISEIYTKGKNRIALSICKKAAIKHIEV